MLSLGGFPPPCNTVPHSILCQCLPFPCRTYQTQLSFLSHGLTHLTIYPVRGHYRTQFRVSASRSRRKGGNRLLEMNDLDDDDDDDEGDDDVFVHLGRRGGNCLLEMEGFDDNDEEEEEEEEDEEGEEEIFIPLGNMKKWLENKPRGFGEGKVYETSIEDKLLEEMRQSREAQLVNINKLKNSPENSNSKKETPRKQDAPEVVPGGVCVRLVNLPKKKNIHRDLQLAFKGVPGIVNIIPAVSGNKRTRDPICKGFAFIDLKSEEDANRFVQIFSRQSISFGKIQKQIRCEMMNSNVPSSASEHSADGSHIAPQQAVPSFREEPDAGFEPFGIGDSHSEDSREIIASDQSDSPEDEYVPAQWEDVNENFESFPSLESRVGDNLGTRTDFSRDSLSSKQKVRPNKKKLEPKRKETKVPKLNIPGSANRLKVKEKAVLTGVLSKYAAQASSASKE